MLTSGQVKRSIQKFGDYSRDLLGSDYNTFDDRLKVFINFCETDTVFSSIHHQLGLVKGVDFDAWLARCEGTVGSMVGSGSLDLPTDEEQRMAIIYEILRRLNSGKLSLTGFVRNFFATGSNRFTDDIIAFNEALTTQFVRELTYRLEDVVLDLPEERSAAVSDQVVQVIHATNVIQQNISGSGNTVSANQTTTAELDRLFEQLRAAALQGIDGKQKQEVEEAVDSAWELAKKSEPKRTVVERLLKMLPPTASVLSIISSILKMLG